MGRLFDGGAYALSGLGLPYLLVASGLALVFVYLAFTRGHPLMRTSLLGAVGGALVWASAQTAALFCVDPAVAVAWYRIAVAPVGIIGPSFLGLVLAADGRLGHHRLLMAVALASGLVSGILGLVTDLVIRDVFWAPAGFWYGAAGPLNALHVGSLAVWFLTALVFASRGARSARVAARARYRRMTIIAVLAALCASDGLLALGIGYYPLSWLGAGAATAMLLFSVARRDVIRARGRDRATLWELVLLAVVALVTSGIFWLAAGVGQAGPVIAATLGVPAVVGAQYAATVLRRRAEAEAERPQVESERATEALVARCAELRDRDELATAIRELLDGSLGLTGVRLYDASGTGLVDPDTGVESQLDARVKAWLIANRRALLAERLEAERLGGLRRPAERFLHSLDAEVALPLVDRGALIGVVATGPRVVDRGLSDAEIRILETVQQASVQALTYLSLYREAEQRVEVAREVEIAAAVQHGRAPGDERLDLAGCRLVSYYQPAGQFGGDWWTAHELVDGRLLVVIGDVTGHGVPAALVTATVEGAAETAIGALGAGFDAHAFLHLLNRSVVDVGRGIYLMSCFVAVYDPEAGAVTFANAGHPFPYVVRPPPSGEGKAGLRALVARGTVLGIEVEPVFAVGRLELARGELLVFYTDALVESRNPGGQPYGERRLQHTLRARAWRAGDRVCEAVMDDARAHYGDTPIEEDVTLVCVRVS